MDKYTIDGFILNRGNQHLFDIANLLFNEAFKDPFFKSARNIYVENNNSKINLIRNLRNKCSLVQKRKLEFLDNQIRKISNIRSKLVETDSPVEIDSPIDSPIEMSKIGLQEMIVDEDIKELLSYLDGSTKQKLSLEEENISKKQKTLPLNLLAAEVLFDSIFIKNEYESQIFPIILSNQTNEIPTFWALNNNKEIDRDIVLVKGPFLNRDSLISYIVSNYIKKCLNSDHLQSIKMVIFDMFPNRTNSNQGIKIIKNNQK